MTATAAPPRLTAPSIGLPAAVEDTPGKFVPRPPTTLRDAGLNPSLVESLIVKFMLNNGAMTGGAVAKALCLPNTAIIEVLAQLKQQQIVVHVGAGGAGDFTYSLTEGGRDRARRMMEESMYVGSAPVPLDAYIASVRAQTITAMNPGPDDLRRAFSDL